MEEKNDLKKIEEQEIKQNILPKDRITYHKEDGEVILKMDSCKKQGRIVERREKLQYKDDIIKNISYGNMPLRVRMIIQICYQSMMQMK